MPANRVPNGIPLSEDAPWEPWSPDEVATRLGRATLRWYVVAGWAIDLFHGEQTRDHEDIEIGTPAADFPAAREALDGFEFDVVGSGERWHVDDQAAFTAHFQTWVRDPVSGVYHLDIFRDPHDGDTWICRRNMSIRMPFDSIIRYTPRDIPYLAPEVVLLFKAKRLREKDQADFDGVVSMLDDEQVTWLREGLALIHPGHPWIDALGAA